MGSKRSVLVDRNGGPLSVVAAGANVHDTKLLELTLESVVVERPDGGDRQPQHLCLDKGIRQSHGPPGGGGARVPGTHQANRRGETGRQGEKRYPARRWVVEGTLSWLSKCRGILVRYDKKASNYVGLVQLACALLWYRRRWQLKF